MPGTGLRNVQLVSGLVVELARVNSDRGQARGGGRHVLIRHADGGRRGTVALLLVLCRDLLPAPHTQA